MVRMDMKKRLGKKAISGIGTILAAIIIGLILTVIILLFYTDAGERIINSILNAFGELFAPD